MNKLILILLLSVVAQATYASFPETFGASSTTMSIGSQSNGSEKDPSNIYYVPALMAFSEKIYAHLSSFVVDTNLDPIHNVTTRNQFTHSEDLTGNVDTDYGTELMAGAHLVLPVLKKGWGKIAASVFIPATYLQELETSQAYQPEYVMYNTRYRRTHLFLHWAQPLGKHWAFSIGLHNGLEVGGNINTIASIDNTNASSAQVQAKAKPALGAILSVMRKGENYQTFLTYQQEMKSKFSSKAFGKTADPISAFQIEIDSMAYYDPHILRWGNAYKWDHFDFFGTLELQDWSGYRTSVARMEQISGVIRGSQNYETVEGETIFVPRFGVQWSDQNISIKSGFYYRPSALESNLNSAGNTLDPATYNLSGGASYKLTLFKIPLELSAGLQVKLIDSEKITKSNNQENGDNGNKIGAPGYDIGGEIYVLSTGINLEF